MNNILDFNVNFVYRGEIVEVEKIHDEILITPESLVTVEDLKSYMKDKLIDLLKEQEKN